MLTGRDLARTTTAVAWQMEANHWLGFVSCSDFSSGIPVSGCAGFARPAQQYRLGVVELQGRCIGPTRSTSPFSQLVDVRYVLCRSTRSGFAWTAL